ncbi:MAG: 23S rRNA (adenine(2503)-C(2))-methyltransferase RlmN [Mogibacterium sp.]|nr:23S rRNA (adenine(2503)-C(2))-methyltransferase RlmN [Mogibacterium sp.]MBQ6389193.1 23S rRNA (adenine(2503)-C(2))-methyltransferase RlmN [Mogibacterium sp.]
MDNDRNLLSLSAQELAELVTRLGDKKFRADQIFGWLGKGAASLDEMTNVPLALRNALTDAGYYIGQPDVITEQISKTDGTRKCLYGFRDGARVESVFMKYSYGNSICISSQVGCRMGCTFCASTIGGKERDLTSGEMLGEVLRMRRHTGEDINHVVIMGMGEPFDNYEEVAGFLRLINSPKGVNLSLRNVTVSTCGIIPMIRRFGEEFPQVNLAVSLHAPNDEIRRRTMPVAKKYPFSDLIRACREYTDRTHRRITFEYALIRDVNDSKENARELAENLRGWLTHVNLIPLNEVRGREYRTSEGTSVLQFRKELEDRGIAVTVRRTLGSDIDAACGQLRAGR